MDYRWKLIRICANCGKEYEQGLENYLRYSQFGEWLAIPHLLWIHVWSCSDCILQEARNTQPRTP